MLGNATGKKTFLRNFEESRGRKYKKLEKTRGMVLGGDWNRKGTRKERIEEKSGTNCRKWENVLDTGTRRVN